MWVNPLTKFDHDDGKDIELLEYLRKCIRFRRQINSLINQHVFADDEQIMEISESLKATSWIADDSIMYIVGNISSAENQYIDLPSTKGDVDGIDIENGSGIKKVVYMDDKTRVYMANAKLACILLNNI